MFYLAVSGIYLLIAMFVTSEKIKEVERVPYNKYAVVVFVVAIAIFAGLRYFNINLLSFGLSTRLILLLGGPIVLFLCVMNLEMGLIFFIYSVPIVNYYIIDKPFNLVFSDVFLIFLIIVWLSRSILRREYVPYRTPLDKYIFLFIILSFFSIINSERLDMALKEIVQTFEYLVFSYYFFSSVVRRRELMNGVLQALVLSSVFYSLYGINQYFANGGGSFRVYSTMGHFNPFGAYLAIMISLNFNMLLSEKNKWTKVLYASTMGLNLVALLMTFSRGAWVAALAAIIISGQFRGMNQFIKMFSVVIVFAVLLTMFTPQRFIGRASTITRVSDDASINRLKQYHIAYETILRYPVFGIGLEGMENYVIKTYGLKSMGEIHNLFLMIGSERGAPAMLTLIFLFVAFFLDAIRKIRKTSDEYFQTLFVGLTAGVLAYIVANLTAYFFTRGLGIVLGIFLGLFQAAAKIEEEDERKKHTPLYIERASYVIR